jgi:CubicO group peptidase (beta-lactamase class C family)
MIIRQPKWTRRAILTSGVLGLGLARLSAAPVKTLTQTKANAVRTKLDAIGRAVEVETRAGRATAISISVAVKGDIFWERGFGVAYRGTARPATAHTPFSLASITKTFTAAAVMRLVESGRLDLDAPIDR